MKRITRFIVAALFVALSSGGMARAQQFFWANYAGLPGGPGSQDGTAATALFNNPTSTAVDNNGNVYVADSANNTIRKISAAGVVTTLAGSPGVAGSSDGSGSEAHFNHPTSIAVTSDGGTIFVADSLNFTIRVVSGGVVTTLAGTAGVSGNADGTGPAAVFGNPVAVATDGAGNVFVADSANNTIRQVTAGGMVTTLAGTPGQVGAVDGTGSAALFNNPSGIAASGGIVYVADTGNHAIRQVTAAGVVTTLAGNLALLGNMNGKGSAASFFYPSGLAIDSTGNIYVADTFNETIRMVTPSGTVSTVAGAMLAGTVTTGTIGDNNATGATASFNYPTGVAVDGNGNLYIADSGNNEIRKVSFGTVTTYAGGAHWGTDFFFTTVVGPAAHFNYPMGMAMGSDGNLYVSDTNNHMIRKIAAAGVGVTLFDGNTTSGVIPIPGYADSTTSTSVRFDYPHGIVADSSGDLYVADTSNQVIRKIVISTQAVTTLCGTAGSIGSADGSTTTAQFNNPIGIAINNAGTNLYVADTYNHTIRQVTSAGVVTTIAGTANTAGSADGTGAAALFDYPSGMAVDATGNIYVADSGNCTIRKLTLSGTTWTSSTLAGSPGVVGNTDATGAGASFNNPTGLSIDSSGNLYVVDTGNHTLRFVTPAGAVTTIAGTSGVAGSVNGIGTAAQFDSPSAVVVGPAGLYILDGGNSRVSLGSLAGTLPATSIGTTIATLTGVADANGVANGYEFQYGTTTAYASTTAVQTLSGTSFGAVSMNVTGLAQNATYHYRLVLTVNGVATYFGTDQTFSTVPTVIPVVTNSSLAAATQGISYTAQITATNLPTLWGATGLPAGLVANPVTGAITGIPTVSGTFNVTLSATNGAGPGTKVLSLVVNPLAVPTFATNLAFSGVTGSAFNYIIPASNSPTGFGATGLPPGLVVNPSNGLINGYPTTPGTYPVTLSETNLTGTGTTGASPFNLTILPTYVWSNFAGAFRSAGSGDGQAASIGLFDFPEGTATDSSGNVYVADTFNFTIRKITPAGVMTTLAGSAGQTGSADGTGSAARFYEPTGIALDSSGNIYVADLFNSTIRKITPAGVVTTLAGLARTTGGTDGTGSAARFDAPAGITVDPSTGMIYVADTGGDTIRAVTPAGVVTTLAGTFSMTGSTNASGSAARFSGPRSIVADGLGNLFVTDTTNNVIRQVTTAGAVTTYAGTVGSSGSTNGTGTAAKFNSPQQITIDGSGNLYVADSGNEQIREIAPGAVVTTYAGSNFGSTNGTGVAAKFEFPAGIAADKNGNLYVADSDDELIRKIAPGAVVTTFAGVVNVSGSTDGIEGTVPEFNTPQGVAVDANDNIYVADTSNNTIREISPTGFVTTLAGTAGSSGTTDGIGSAARFKSPTSLAFDSNGNLFVADSGNDTIRKLTFAAGVGWTSSTFAGTAGTAGANNATGTAATFSTPTSVAIDSSNNIYVADSVNDLVRKITPAGAVTTFAGVVGSTGTTNGAAASAKFNTPTGVAVDASGNVYVADLTNNLVREISAGTVSTVAGSTAAEIDGIGTAASFEGPAGIVVDSSGTIYVTDSSFSCIRRIAPIGTSWSVTTIGGNNYGLTPTGATASFNGPKGIAVDAHGNLMVADTNDEEIVVGAAILPPSITSALTASGTQNSPFTYGITATNTPSPFSSFGASSLPAGLSVNTITGAITGTPTGNGSFSPIISATNLAGTASATLSLSIASTQSPYQAWQGTQFSAGQLGDPDVSGDNATPAHDGIPNLVKYALGLNAFQAYNPGDPNLPLVQVPIGTNFLTLSFNGTATDVTYIVQATSNLNGAWTTIQTFNAGIAPGKVTVQDTQTIGTTSGRYMRLQVTH